jgi:hypothetical protein
MARAISSRSSRVSSSVAAPIHPSTCSGERAPTIAPVTPGHARVQAIATALTVVSCRRAIGRSASRSDKLRLKRGGLKSGERRRQSSGARAWTRLSVNRSVRLRSLASYEREGWLQRIHVAYRLTALEQTDIEVGKRRSPGPFPHRPASPSFPSSPRPQCWSDPANETGKGRSVPGRVIPYWSTLGKDEGPIARSHPVQSLTDHHLRMA